MIEHIHEKDEDVENPSEDRRHDGTFEGPRDSIVHHHY